MTSQQFSQKPNSQQKPSSQGRNSDYRDVKGSPGWIDWIANAIVLVITAPINFFAKLLNPFVERGGAGIQALGAVAFLGGVLVGTDNFFQMFTGIALLPWFTEHKWAGDTSVWGMSGWPAVIGYVVSITFVVSLSLSLLTQFIQGQAIRGRTLNAAKANFEHWNSANLPSEPDSDRKLDMASISYKQLKSVGKKQNKFIGFISVSLWILEAVSALYAHNPMNYVGQSGLFLACTAYAIMTIFAGETGYTIWCQAKDESQIQTL